jgi:hypothetical protein
MQRGLGTMLLATIPALLSIALFVATLALRPDRSRATLLPPRPFRPRT